MAVDKRAVEPYHSFDVWRQVTNLILNDQGDLDQFVNDLSDKNNLVEAVNFVYTSTQVRLRVALIRSIGMS